MSVVEAMSVRCVCVFNYVWVRELGRWGVYNVVVGKGNTYTAPLNILHFEKKGPLMNSLEQFHIYRISKDNLLLNDTHTDTYNPIFNLITKYYK
jgi:hypothetical protein